MRPGPLTVLGIVDHAVDTARRHPRFVLSTIAAGSLPLALGGAVAVHLVRMSGADLLGTLAGAAFLALLVIPRAVGWGACVIGLKGILDEEPVAPWAAWRGAFVKAPQLYAVHAAPLFWSLLGLLAVLGPLTLAILASNVESIFKSVGVTIAASTAGSFITVFAAMFVSRRTLALPVAAVTGLGPGPSLRRSIELSRGQTIRIVSLQLFLAVLQVLVWITLVQSAPFALGAAEILTGHSFLEVRGALTIGDPSYLAFQAAIAFLIMDPIRCLSVGYFHQDGETRRSGADLKARLERLSPPAAAPQPEEAGWRG
jgi:hypothetical protein